MPYSKKSCPQCGKEHANPKFCSRSCSAVYHKRPSFSRVLSQRRGTMQRLRNNDKQTESEVSNLASAKWQSERTLSDSVTLEEAVLRYKNHHPSSAFALVRTRARVVMKREGRYGKCEWCGYDKHTEACHRTAIKDFDPSTTITRDKRSRKPSGAVSQLPLGTRQTWQKRISLL